MIPTEDYTGQKKVYTKNKEGRWKIVAYCASPSLTMINLDTGERANFGIGGLIAEAFEPVRDATEDDMEDFFRVCGLAD
jgi:hypothetical protein